VLRQDTNVSEVLKMEAAWTFETLVSCYNTARRHSSKDLDSEYHRSENLKTCTRI